MKLPGLYIKFLTGLIIYSAFAACSKEQVITPVRKDFINSVFASGYIIKENEYMVTANTEGFIKQTLVQEGDSITRETPLFKLSDNVQNQQLENALANYNNARVKATPGISPQINQLNTQIDQAKNQLLIDKKNYLRYAALIKTGAVSLSEYEKAKLQYETSTNNLKLLNQELKDLKLSLELNLENTKNQLQIQQYNTEDYLIRSEISGIVLSIVKEQGELVRKGEIIAQIGGGEDVIKLYIAEEDIGKIAVGQKIIISLNTQKDDILEGIVTKIFPSFDEKEQSFIIEAHFANKYSSLFNKTQLQANIIIETKKNALVIPTSYLLKENQVVLANGNIIEIKKGISNNQWTEIIEGLTETSAIVLPKNK
ncbi:efflux RND transporter periplasmic adaptor subunit [Abyssalbus ytuae]|uniref:Efflux RND transporter periplasmic adaptor subunit n=1 Tax=Abyssalbus ytuae TaxID=2926907 RepID=A0A9E7D3R6_9FLAO|nr:HlyD family efflux transporter periplasmic adaptor subunit [Abyssalbus ytuae]UOB18129.1 efflux RND transporter periplasmic adaptor subunit [Abyssalbus ytuae]